MKRTNSESIEFWRNHISKAKSQPGSIIGYCKENNLLESSFYYWRDKIFGKKEIKSKKETKKAKKVMSSFLPVVVTANELNPKNYPQQHIRRQLPESRWVAEIITNVIRGLL